MSKEKESKISITLVISVVVFAIFSSVGGVFGSEIATFLISNSTSEGISDKALTEQAEKINRNLPMMIDSETQLSSVNGFNNSFHYNYKLINYKGSEIDKTNFENSMRKQVLKNYCTHPDMKTFRDNDVTLQYNYKDKDGNFFTKMVIKAGECE